MIRRTGRTGRTGRTRPPTRAELRRRDLEALVGLAAGGDETALELFVERTIDDVHRYCTFLTGPDASEDLVQITYLKAIRSLDRFRGESSARTWLLGIARHASMDELRARYRRDRLDTKLRADAASSITSAPERLPLELRAALAELEPKRREAFVLTQLLALPYAEAADLVGCPVGTIRSRVARARIQVLDHLEQAEVASAPRITPDAPVASVDLLGG